jgi:hypothetical protein
MLFLSVGNPGGCLITRVAACGSTSPRAARGMSHSPLLPSAHCGSVNIHPAGPPRTVGPKGRSPTDKNRIACRPSCTAPTVPHSPTAGLRGDNPLSRMVFFPSDLATGPCCVTHCSSPSVPLIGAMRRNDSASEANCKQPPRTDARAEFRINVPSAVEQVGGIPTNGCIGGTNGSAERPDAGTGGFAPLRGAPDNSRSKTSLRATD